MRFAWDLYPSPGFRKRACIIGGGVTPARLDLLHCLEDARCSASDSDAILGVVVEALERTRTREKSRRSGEICFPILTS